VALYGALASGAELTVTKAGGMYAYDQETSGGWSAVSPEFPSEHRSFAEPPQVTDGVPIIATNGRFIGAVSVCGGTPDQDIDIATAGVNAVDSIHATETLPSKRCD
jgi:uncharacterized protein GlcG (DUF336 family)